MAISLIALTSMGVASSLKPDTIEVRQIQIVPGHFTYVLDNRLMRELAFTSIPYIGREQGLEIIYYTLEHKSDGDILFKNVDITQSDDEQHGFRENQSSSDCIKKGVFFYQTDNNVFAETIELLAGGIHDQDKSRLKAAIFAIEQTINQQGENGLTYNLIDTTITSDSTVCGRKSMQEYAQQHVTNLVRGGNYGQLYKR